MLELIQNNPENRQQSVPPLLFIHGMWHGAWCWQAKFLPYLEKLGIKAYAMSLSAHGMSLKRKPLNYFSIDNYVEDVQVIVNNMEETPILVGHSMGGFIVQKYLEKNKVPKAVLMSSVPPYGIWAGTWMVLKRYPGSFLKANFTLNLKHILPTAERFATSVTATDLPREEIEQYYSHIESESFRAYMDMMGLNLVKPNKIDTPLLIMGGGKDMVAPPRIIKKTAKIFQTEAVIYPNLGHDMMLEVGFEKVADDIVSWVMN